MIFPSEMKKGSIDRGVQECDVQQEESSTIRENQFKLCQSSVVVPCETRRLSPYDNDIRAPLSLVPLYLQSDYALDFALFTVTDAGKPIKSRSRLFGDLRGLTEKVSSFHYTCSTLIKTGS